MSAPEGDDRSLERIERLERRLARERQARLDAERIAEETTSQLYEALRVAELANDELESFVYTASHDLRNPLIAILSYLDLMEEGGDPTGSEDAHFLTRMRWNADLMRQLVDDLLEVSRVGRVEVEPDEVPLGPLIDELASMLGDRYPDLEVRHADLPVLWVNPLRVKQVFGNLLENAAKYAGPVVHVDISCRSTDQGVALHVDDDGPGVPEEHRERIFGLFERAGDTSLPGTGVGLAICRKYLRSVDGDIRLAASPTGGARFVVTLPDDHVRSGPVG